MGDAMTWWCRLFHVDAWIVGFIVDDVLVRLECTRCKQVAFVSKACVCGRPRGHND